MLFSAARHLGAIACSAVIAAVPARCKAFSRPGDYRSRGTADPSRASRHQRDRNVETSHRRPTGPATLAVPMLRRGLEQAE